VPKLTLVADDLAQPGFRFTFAGPNPGEECRGCPFQKLCFGLEPHHAYEVVALREMRHPCKLHEPGKVRVVQVKEVAFPSSLETRHLRGTAAQWAPIPCRKPSCANWKLCHPAGAGAGKHEIVTQGEALECPAGYDIVRVDLKPMPK
jgi:uncharacterized protein